MNRTKELIVDTFWQLLEEKPYNKITVQDIVNRCKVNRNTFYYHFQDIPSLAENSIENWMDGVIRNQDVSDSPARCLTQMASECMKREKAILHLYRSARKDSLLESLNKLGFHIVRSFVDSTMKNLSVSEDDKEILIRYYKCTFVGILLDWLDNGASYNLVDFYGKLCSLFSGYASEMVKYFLPYNLPKHNPE